MAVFDQLGNKKNPGLCSDGITNVCEVRNQIHEKSKEKICHFCKQQLTETIKNPIIDKMTLESFLTLSINDRIEFMIKHKLRRNHRIIGKYMPDKMNRFAKAREMKGLDRNQITLGEIYFTYNTYIAYLKKKYKESRGIKGMDTLLETIEQEHQISEFFEYNTRARNKSERGINFKITKKRPSNTTLQGSLDYGNISDIEIIDQTGQKISITTIPQLTIKSNRFEKLSDQIKEYINHPKTYIQETGLPFEKNKNALIAYLHIVSIIEGACMTNYSQAVSYVESIMKSWKEDREKRFLKIQGNQKQDGTFEIAPHKRISRAVEKLIINYDGDISKATDNCRGTLTFETVDDLQKGMIVFVDTLKEYNRNQKDKKKQVTEVFLSDNYDNLLETSSKASGYRDGKLVIKIGDGNVIELMLHLRNMHIAKDEGFSYIDKKSIPNIIQKLALTKEEINKINKIIDRIDHEGTKRGTIMEISGKGNKLPHIEEIQEGEKLPADFIYNIYRNLPEYDRRKKETLPLEKEISKWSLMEKLQLLEREIYERGYKQQLNKIYEKVMNSKHEQSDNKLKKRLL